MIRDILDRLEIGTQKELQAALRKIGQRVDQSTLSRDLQELGVRKLDGRYALPPESNGTAVFGVSALIRQIVPCGPHLIVLKTTVGQAQPVALMIDAKRDHAIVATLAGDDVVFVATRNRKAQAVALRHIQHWFGEPGEGQR